MGSLDIGGDAPRVLLPGAGGAQPDQGAPGGESRGAVRAGAPQTEAGVSGARGAGSGRPPHQGPVRGKAVVFQQLGAGELDTEASAGEKWMCFTGCLDLSSPPCVCVSDMI